MSEVASLLGKLTEPRWRLQAVDWEKDEVLYSFFKAVHILLDRKVAYHTRSEVTGGETWDGDVSVFTQEVNVDAFRDPELMPYPGISSIIQDLVPWWRDYLSSNAGGNENRQEE